jgi:hypothetical protein
MIIPPLKFNEVVPQQSERLSRVVHQGICANLEEFIDVIEATRDDTSLATALVNQLDIGSFTDGWEPLGHRFLKQRQICGGIAKAFPGKSTVESDFFVLN